MQILPCTKSCFVCGESNVQGLHLRFHTDGTIVQAEFTPTPTHAGFPGIVHGGITATLLDEIMVWAGAVNTRRFGYCAELQVRYLRPLAIGARSIIRGRLTENRKNRILLAAAELLDGNGETLATATGKYIPVPEAALAEFNADLVGDPAIFKTEK